MKLRRIVSEAARDAVVRLLLGAVAKPACINCQILLEVVESQKEDVRIAEGEKYEAFRSARLGETRLKEAEQNNAKLRGYLSDAAMREAAQRKVAS